jgi:hypothetical protein
VKKTFLALAGFSFFILYFFSNLTVWENISVSMLIYFLLEFIDDMGNRIVIMDFAILLAIFTCLVMPAIFYHEYTRSFPLAQLWVKYMPIESDEYFSFAVPAVIMLILGLRFPIAKLKINKRPAVYIDNVKRRLVKSPNLGLILIAIGAVSGFLDFLSPSSLKQVFFLLDNLTYVGVFYVIYSPNKYKKYVVPGVLLVMIAQTVATGMFGEFVYILACSVVLMILGKKLSFSFKLSCCLVGIAMIVILQSIKTDYRERTWAKNGGGGDAIYYAQLIGNRIIDPSAIVDPTKLFFIAVRMNQGWLVAVTMNKVPRKYPYANGETIWNSVAASIVPRFIWQDKPKVGGAANLKRFWGYDIVGYSMNIGPMGEAYGNFGVIGGIIFMFFYGLFFNVMLSGILKMAEKRPTLILWLPFLFFYAIGIETDLLTTMGSLIKGLIFTWLVFKVFKIGIRIDL